MLYYALIFFAVALVSGTLGFTGIAGATAGVAQFIFFGSLALCVTLFIFNRHGHSVTVSWHDTDDKS
ncbi:DUF1328 domain-containing protein [Dyella sp. LX-66]|uniref:DUF1328 domain-containing protein n=1 Tax=Dyella TaxID=231454 RepID=UPI001BE10F3D|nr:DUF1328 domain-containing protein [Dyella sp. LX-1]MBT2142113.1 DUF1328 domain-containing protein [Dyella sp. LX-66]